MNLFYMAKTFYIFWPPVVAIFSEVLYEGYVTKISQPMCSYKILSSKYVV